MQCFNTSAEPIKLIFSFYFLLLFLRLVVLKIRPFNNVLKSVEILCLFMKFKFWCFIQRYKCGDSHFSNVLYILCTHPAPYKTYILHLFVWSSFAGNALLHINRSSVLIFHGCVSLVYTKWISFSLLFTNN